MKILTFNFHNHYFSEFAIHFLPTILCNHYTPYQLFVIIFTRHVHLNVIHLIMLHTVTTTGRTLYLPMVKLKTKKAQKFG